MYHRDLVNRRAAPVLLQHLRQPQPLIESDDEQAPRQRAAAANRGREVTGRYNQLLEQLLLQYGTAISTRLTEREVTESREPVSGAVHNQNRDLKQQDELKMQQKIQRRIVVVLQQPQTCTCCS